MSVADIAISGAVEGDVDEAVFRRLVDDAGCHVGPIYGKKGKPFLRTRIEGYNAAARYSHWLVLVDLDEDYPCANALREDWLPVREPRMCFRVVLRAVESWLMSDVQKFCDYFSIARRHMPANIEQLAKPKDALVALMNHSRRRDVREDIIPRPQSGRRVGPAYSSRLIEFVADKNNGWRPTAGAANSDSLRRCLNAIDNFIDT